MTPKYMALVFVVIVALCIVSGLSAATDTRPYLFQAETPTPGASPIIEVSPLVTSLPEDPTLSVTIITPYLGPTLEATPEGITFTPDFTPEFEPSPIIETPSETPSQISATETPYPEPTLTMVLEYTATETPLMEMVTPQPTAIGTPIPTIITTPRSSINFISPDRDQIVLFVLDPVTMAFSPSTIVENLNILFEDTILEGDFDGDKSIDLAIFSPATSAWTTGLNRGPLYDFSVVSPMAYSHLQKPFVVDTNSDGIDEILLYNPPADFSVFQLMGQDFSRLYQFSIAGLSGDQIILGEFDDIAGIDIAVVDAQGVWQLNSNASVVRFSLPPDTNHFPFTGDFDGNGRSDFGSINSNGSIDIGINYAQQSIAFTVLYIQEDSTIVVSDVDGDQIDEIISFNATNQWTLWKYMSYVWTQIAAGNVSVTGMPVSGIYVVAPNPATPSQPLPTITLPTQTPYDELSFVCSKIGVLAGETINIQHINNLAAVILSDSDLTNYDLNQDSSTDVLDVQFLARFINQKCN